MGRPSLKQEKKKEIIAAAKRLAARSGIGGLTLESIAKEANIARPLVRHNLGNKEQIIAALVEDFTAQSRIYLDEYRKRMSNDNPLTDLVELLFDPSHSDSEFNLLGNALVMEGANSEPIKVSMRNWTVGFIEFISGAAKIEYPDASKKLVMDCAVGISGLFFSVESMLASGEITGFRESSLASARYLVEKLESRSSDN